MPEKVSDVQAQMRKLVERVDKLEKGAGGPVKKCRRSSGAGG